MISSEEVHLGDEEKGRLCPDPPVVNSSPSSLREKNERTAFKNRSKSLDMDAEDIDAISSNLIQVSPFTTPATPKSNGNKDRDREALSQELKGDEVLMLEITSDGQQSFKNMRLRELLEYVNAEARRLDSKGGGFGVGKQKDKILKAIFICTITVSINI